MNLDSMYLVQLLEIEIKVDYVLEIWKFLLKDNNL